VRGRAAGRLIAKTLDDPRDPCTIEILAGDDDNAAAPEEVNVAGMIRPCQNPMMGTGRTG
jgi:hypothetical protein